MSAAQKRMANQLFGYRVLKHLGDGAASRVYAVRHPKTKQIWALKHVLLTDTDKDQRFLDQVTQEYEVSAKLDHPAIRKMHELCKERIGLFKVGGLGLVMELVDATPLSELPRPPMPQCVDLFLQVAHALQHMHDRGFVHADMKPLNILVDESGTAKIIDLGQACKNGTKKDRVQGTPGYLAVEQAARDEITPQTDVFNFGCTMWWVLLRNQAPQACQADGSTRHQRGSDVPAPRKLDPSIPEDLSVLMMRCLEEKPYQRVKLGWVVRKLEEIQRSLQPAAMPLVRTSQAG
ncbi:MAG: serine/threonine-protein kinase [Phycisphaerae bacterium]|nr:serine/threonine-protein kinase [Phycisphaerae bacterium]